MATLSVINLEQYLSDDLWNSRDRLDLPDNIKRQIQEDIDVGYPCGIGRHPDIGLFVIESGGQGPYLIYQELERVEKLV